MERRIKAIVFDLGYTLIYFDGDFQEVVYESYLVLADQFIQTGCNIDRQAFANRFSEMMQQYYAQREVDLLEQPIHVLVNQVLNEFGRNDLTTEQIVAALHQMYLVTESHWKLEKNAHETLKVLNQTGYALGLISNASDAWDANNLIDGHRLREHFKVTLISAAEGIRKPDKRIFERAAQKMGIDLSEMVMVGDTLNADILGARRSGMRTVWISKYVESMRGLLEVYPEFTPDNEIHDLGELPDLLNSWERNTSRTAQ